MNTAPIVSFFISRNLTRFFENISPHECFLARFAKVKHPRINLFSLNGAAIASGGFVASNVNL